MVGEAEPASCLDWLDPNKGCGAEDGDVVETNLQLTDRDSIRASGETIVNPQDITFDRC